MELIMKPDFTGASRTRKSEKGRWIIAAALAGILSTFAVSGAQAQVIVDEDFADDLQKDAAATTADWNTVATELKLPTVGSLVPVQSLTGSFLPAASSSQLDVADSSASRATAVGDLNGDGFVDIAFGNATANRVYFNNGAGALTFSKGTNVSGGGNTRSAAIADLNGDGHMDLVFAEFGGGQATRVNFNNGSGADPVFDSSNFVELGDPVLAGDSVATGDVDNDGDIDVVLGLNNSYVKVFRNDGFGNFSAAEDIADTAPAFGFHVRSVMLGDVDGDGDLDVVAAREQETTRIYINDGAGNFGSTQSAGGASSVQNRLPAPDSASLGDVDGDGDLDLLVGNDGSGTVLGSGAANYLFINSGNAADIYPSLTFSFADLANTNDTAMIDVDKDGDLDIVTADFVSGNGNDIPGPNRVYLNNGAGNFPATGSEFTANSNVTKSLGSGDFDADGDIDLVFGNEDANLSTAVNIVVENEGVLSGVSSDQLYATGESLDVSAILTAGVFLDPSTSPLATDVESDRVFQYWLSDDGGLTWITAHRNRSVAFPSPVGNTLRWRVDFASPSPLLRPTIGRMLLRTNLAPSFTSTVVTAATQDVAYQYDITTSDAQGDILDIRETATLPLWLTLTDNGDGTATLAGTPLSADVAGPNDVALEVADGAGLTDAQAFTIVVADTNDAPTVIAPTGDQVYTQDETITPLNTSLAFDDVDGDTLAYSATGLPASLTLDVNTGVVTGTLTNDDALASPHSVVITATEVGTAELFSVADSFTMTVTNVNDAPTVITPIVDQTIDQGTVVNLDISTAFEDIDLDTLSYSATGLPASLTLDANTGVVTGTLTNDDVLAGPDYLVEVTATEVGTADLFSVAGSFTLTVNNVNDAPTVVTSTGDQVFAQGDAVNINTSLAFEDIDGDTLTYSATGLPASLTLDPNTGALTGTLTNADAIASPYPIVITADDGNTGTVGDSFTMTVNNTNDAPTFTSTPLTAATEGSLYSYSIVAQDIDGDALAISGTVPGWLTLTDNGDGTALLAGTPASSDIGDVPVTLTVNDGAIPANQPFTITVVAAADAPVITILGDNPVTVEQGDTYTDAGATALDAQDGAVPVIEFSNNVDTSTVGNYAITYQATDSAGNTAQLERVVNVVDTAAPVITLTGGNVTLTVGDTYTDQGATADDGLNGDISADIVIDQSAVNTATAGTYTVTYNVTDASGNAATEVTRTVTVNNPAPPPPAPAPRSGGGGSTSLPVLLLLAGLACGRRRRKQLDS